MKNKFFNNILLIVLSLGFIGCEDYVDYEASENYTIVADDYFKTSADYEAALVGTYDVLQWNIYSVMIGDIASDNSFCGGESATDVIGMQKIDDMIHVPNNDQLTSTWKWLYEGINRANYMIENKDKLDFSRKAELYGEVHFLRAYYYFELVKIFGDVPLFTDSRLTASLEASEIHKLSIALTDIPGYDPQAVRGFVLTSGSTVDSDDLLMGLTKVNGANIEFFVSASAGAAPIDQNSNFKVFYQKTTTMSPYEVGDFEAGNDFAFPNAASATDIDIPEINIQMRSEAIVAKTKKLKAVWTPEFAQDLNAYQALDAEAEVTNIMSEYISLEIDLEILDMLINDAAAGTEYWSAKNNRFINSAATSFENDTNGFYNTQGGWFQTLGTKIQKLSNKIHQLTLRGGANFTVCSPTVATVLESIPFAISL